MIARTIGSLAVVGILVTSAHADDDSFKEVKPAPGRDAVKPMKPDWCAGYTPTERGICDVHCQDRAVSSAAGNWSGQTNETDLPWIAALACDFAGNDNAQRQFAAFRQSWVNRTGLSEAADREALKIYVKLAGRGVLSDAVTEACKKLVPTAEQNSVERDHQQVVHDALCAKDLFGRDNLHASREVRDLLWTERPDKPSSEIARAYYVLNGLPVFDQTRSDFSMMLGEAKKVFPLFSTLGSHADRKAFDAEVAALGLSGLLKARATALASYSASVFKLWSDAVRADAKNEPQLAKAIQSADAGFGAWSKLYQDHKVVFDAAFVAEDKVMALSWNDRQTSHKVGCEDLRKTLLDYAASQKPKTKAAVKAALTDSVGYVALARLVMCDALEGRWADAAAEQQVLNTGRYAAGPMMSALWAVVDGGADRPYTKELHDDIYQVAGLILNNQVRETTTLNEVYDGHGGISEEQFKKQGRMIEQGRVATVKKSGDGVDVTFKKEKWSEPDFKCTNTGRVIQWAPNGAPQYDTHCVVSGSHTEEYQLEPRHFSDRSGAELKPGQIVKVVTSTLMTKPPIASSFVLEVDEPAKGKAPPAVVSYFGVKLK